MLSKLFFLIVALSIHSHLSSVQGLKCYVCENWACAYPNPRWDPDEGEHFLEYTKQYLIDCGPSAISCASFSAQTKDPYSPSDEIWFQRVCLYSTDVTCIGKDFQNFPKTEFWREEESVFYPDWISCINSFRKPKNLPEMKQVDSESLIQSRASKVSVFFQSCRNITDGCNIWVGESKERVPIALAEGFPMDMHEKRKKSYKTNCYSCSSDDGTNQCEKRYKEFAKDSQASIDAYGCTMLAIYQIAGGMKARHYFQRGLWFPGDQWCLERKFKSTPENLRQLVERASIQYFTRSTQPCTQEDYSRALKSKELNSGYEWIGQRKFYSAEEFTDYVRCREHVTNKLGITATRPIFNYDKDAAVKALSGKSDVFAFVGFRFCSPTNFCNGWTELELYEKMVDPPATSTTFKPDVSMSTEAPKSTTLSTKIETKDGCNKVNGAAPKTIALLSIGMFVILCLARISHF